MATPSGGKDGKELSLTDGGTVKLEDSLTVSF